jgi:hypothetical protein
MWAVMRMVSLVLSYDRSQFAGPSEFVFFSFRKLHFSINITQLTYISKITSHKYSHMTLGMPLPQKVAAVHF